MQEPTPNPIGTESLIGKDSLIGMDDRHPSRAAARGQAFPRAMSALTPEVVAERVRIVLPEGIVAVQGFAENISESWTPRGGRPVVFGDLVLGSVLLSFQVPVETAPREGEPVIIEGTLRGRIITQPSGPAWRGNWKVTLVGQVVGNWTPRAAPKPLVALPERGERIPLNDFVLRHGVGSLLILSSKVGRRDVAQSLASANRREKPSFVEANFGDIRAFLQAVAAIPADGSVRGVALARGGGHGLELIGGSREVVAALIQRRMPFYTALGHDTDIVLADRSADQVFHSPSELGSAIARAADNADALAERNRRLNSQAKLIDQQKMQLDSQARLLVDLQNDMVHMGDAMNARVTRLRIMLIGAALALALLAWMLFR